MGRKTGSMGVAGAFSIYHEEHDHGEGGIITTNDDKIAYRARLLRNHGQTKKYLHEELGWNLR